MSGYGRSQGGNKVFFTLKVKRGENVDPHIEVREHDGSSYKKVDDQCTWVAGMFAGIDHAKYKISENAKTEKDKILIYLQGKEKLYVVQTAMNSHARNIMNSLIKLIGAENDNIGEVKFTVYQKGEYANISIKHNDEFVDWQFPYDEQVKYIKDGGDGYKDYSAFEELLLGKWKAAAEFLKQFPVYEERKSIGDADGADQPANTAEPVQSENPTPIGQEDEPDDLPF